VTSEKVTYTVISLVDLDPGERMLDPSIPNWDLSVPLNGAQTLLSEVRTVHGRISG
jgi:hypothetical protein